MAEVLSSTACAIVSWLGLRDRGAHTLGVLGGLDPNALRDTLDAVSGATSVPRLSVSADLGQRLRPLAPPVRAVRAFALLDALVPRLALLDEIELLFLPDLALRPVAVLRQLARTRTLVVAWTLPDSAAEELFRDRGELRHARPDHPEFTLDRVADVTRWILPRDTP